MDDEALIAAVFKRGTVWNPSEELHKNALVLKKLLEEVAEELNKSGKYVHCYFINYYVLINIKYQFNSFESLLLLKHTAGVWSKKKDSSIPTDSEPQSTTDLSCDEEIQSPVLPPDGQSFNTPQSQRKKIRSTVSGSSQKSDQLLELERKKVELLEKDSEKE
jgi:hypothetical protein